MFKQAEGLFPIARMAKPLPFVLLSGATTARWAVIPAQADRPSRSLVLLISFCQSHRPAPWLSWHQQQKLKHRFTVEKVSKPRNKWNQVLLGTHGGPGAAESERVLFSAMPPEAGPISLPARPAWHKHNRDIWDDTLVSSGGSLPASFSATVWLFAKIRSLISFLCKREGLTVNDVWHFIWFHPCSCLNQLSDSRWLANLLCFLRKSFAIQHLCGSPAFSVSYSYARFGGKLAFFK